MIDLGLVGGNSMKENEERDERMYLWRNYQIVYRILIAPLAGVAWPLDGKYFTVLDAGWVALFLVVGNGAQWTRNRQFVTKNT